MDTAIYGCLRKAEASWICFRCGLLNIIKIPLSSQNITNSNPFATREENDPYDFTYQEGHNMASSSPKHSENKRYL